MLRSLVPEHSPRPEGYARLRVRIREAWLHHLRPFTNSPARANSGGATDLVSSSELPPETELLLCDPLTDPDEDPYDAEDDEDGGQDAEGVGGDATTAAGGLARVEDGVDIPALGRVGDVGEGEVEAE